MPETEATPTLEQEDSEWIPNQWKGMWTLIWYFTSGKRRSSKTALDKSIFTGCLLMVAPSYIVIHLFAPKSFFRLVQLVPIRLTLYIRDFGNNRRNEV